MDELDAKGKIIFLVMPTIGEAVQSFQLSKELKEIFPDNPVYPVAGDNDAYSCVKNIKGIDGLLLYNNDTEQDAYNFLKTFDPSLILFIENCYYPYLVLEAKRTGITTLLVSAAMNDAIREHPRYRMCSLMDAYRSFSYIGVKSPVYTENFVALGVEDKKIFVSGDLKMDFNRLSIPEKEKGYHRRLMGLEGRKVFIAGSVSRNEGKIVIDVCRRLLSLGRDIKCIIAPRFLDDITDFKRYAEELSLTVTLKTELNNSPGRDTGDVILLDTYGELGRFYALGDTVFVGGTLKPFAGKTLGQNILEPLFHCSPIVVGPNVKKDTDVLERLRKFWQDIVVNDPEGLFNSVSFLLLNDDFKDRYASFIRDNIRLENNMTGLRKKLQEIRDIIITA